MQELDPEYTPPPFSPQGFIAFIEKTVKHLAPNLRSEILGKLRSSLTEDVFDIETWKGLWYLINYNVKYQLDFVKRRITGEYETDEWGLDWELVDTIRPFLDFLYKVYWRVEVTGLEHIPDYGRALIVSNHSGQLPFDGVMIGTAIYNDHPSQRLIRNLYASWFPTLPFLSSFLERTGQVMADTENGIRLLENDELVGVFPEGYKGVGKLFKDRYKLARFGRGGFAKMALQTGAPMIPTAVVGAEETFVALHKSDTLARLTGFPYFPISLRFPWLGIFGIIPFPTKWYIDFGEPIPTDTYGPEAANNINLVSQLSNQTRNVVQDMINNRLAQRRSVFF
ncbi:MAG: acyltransferase family protein [Ardenticatenaceae bacterium]|nr:acyltransferase family protein [Ardenticatenaceae bacterium]MCB9004876.1 acyltransferase family protein [Ardenticatenaceae bacterium]